MKHWKGIILAGGRGTRMLPHTITTSKHLLPVYDKPLINYSLSVLIYAGIKEVLIIVNPEHKKQFISLLGDGSHLGMSIEYLDQESPKGIADAFIIAEKFIDKSNIALVLGDNIFHGMGFLPLINEAKERIEGCSIFTYPVEDTSRFGILERNRNGEPISLIEKPDSSASNQAITGR